MKYIFSPLVIFSAATIALPASADFPVVATPLKGTPPAVFQKVLRNKLILSSTPVFDAAEARAIGQLGDSRLALSTRLTLLNVKAYQELKSWVAAQGIGVDLSPAALPLRLENLDRNSEPLAYEQWGLQNDGRDRYAPIDQFTDITLPGRAGEDIGLSRVLPERSVSKPVIVAVLDTGVELGHPDLKARIVTKPQECEALESYKACIKKEPRGACDKKWAKVDSDGNGYPLDCSGWNVTVAKNPLTGIQGNGNPADDLGHGTHVAGVIAAPKNGIGIRGVSDNAFILPIKVITASPKGPVRPQQTDPLPDPTENGTDWDTGFADVIARGLLYAIRSGAQVANLSLAWPLSADSELMRGMVQLAQARGMVVVAAAGNDATEASVLPCNYSGVLCVAAHSPDGSLTRFSNHGSGVDLAAPGINILSTWPMSMRPKQFTDFIGFELKNGTSMAAPFVAGAAARLLAEGVPADETYARLLLGSRSRAIDALGKSTRFGNLDLAGAGSVLPQPLILPESKDALPLVWDRRSGNIPFVLPLANRWKSASSARITLKLSERAGKFAQLQNSEWSAADWGEGEIRELESALLIMDPETSRIPSELVLDLTVSADGFEARTYRVRVQLTVPISPALQDPAIQSIGIRGGSIPEQAIIRSVQYAGKNALTPPHDYVAIEKGPRTWKLQLLTREQRADGEEIGDYTIRAALDLAPPAGDLLSLYRLDWNFDGTDEYAFLFTMPHPQGKKNAAFQLHFMDRGLKTVRKLDYAADQTMLPENFQWLALKDRLTPAWVNYGFTPPLEKSTKYDPWNPQPSDQPTARLYYLADDGLRSVTPPTENVFIAALPLSSEESASDFGTVRVLLAKGNSYQLQYSTARVRASGDRHSAEDVRPLNLAKYRMLVGTDTQIPVFSTDPGGLTAGVAFGTLGSKNSYRTTVLLPNGSVFDQTQRPVSPGDTVLRLAGAFVGQGRAGAFVQTQYDLQFHDFGLKQAVGTSLRRFSFIPQLSFLRSFLPVVVRDAAQGKASPGALVLGDLSGSETSEVVIPIYDDTGSLAGLESPARLRLIAGEGCRRIGNPIDADALAPTRVLYFCGDRFLSVPQLW